MIDLIFYKDDRAEYTSIKNASLQRLRLCNLEVCCNIENYRLDFHSSSYIIQIHYVIRP